ncbi:glycosyltransferase family 2 protein [Gottfriedia sp. NPDC058432]|uniref:glycosyltransferase family 2 protein n=1 Tax=Gottfriedia sp. NPDC058432 TaxID=3346497 RepID=UPI00365FDA0D
MENKVGICICTFKRQFDLTRLLNSLLDLSNTIKFTTIVVDNDKNGSAHNTYNSFKDQIQIIYEIEENQGLSNARNKCIKIARELNLDYIVFLDDDEVVKSKDWLKNLLDMENKSNSGIVTGPVLPLYHPKVKEHIRQSGFFSPTRHKDGARLPYTGTGNTLIKMAILSEMEEVFNPKFNLSGGEDTYLFSQLVKNGNEIIWCDDAEVLEYIPLERGNMRYVFKRSFYSSINFTKIEPTLNLNDKKVTIRLLRIGKGIIKLSKGLYYILLSPFIGLYKFVQGISFLGNGFGDIIGVLGMNSYLYKN